MSATDALRERLRTFLDDAAKVRGEVECPMCKGTGRAIRQVRSVTQSDVAKVIGVTRTTVTGFLSGKQGLTYDAGITLGLWLDSPEIAVLTRDTQEPSHDQ